MFTVIEPSSSDGFLTPDEVNPEKMFVVRYRKESGMIALLEMGFAPDIGSHPSRRKTIMVWTWRWLQPQDFSRVPADKARWETAREAVSDAIVNSKVLCFETQAEFAVWFAAAASKGSVLRDEDEVSECCATAAEVIARAEERRQTGSNW
jgi:hypothetical protein